MSTLAGTNPEEANSIGSTPPILRYGSPQTPVWRLSKLAVLSPFAATVAAVPWRHITGDTLARLLYSAHLPLSPPEPYFTFGPLVVSFLVCCIAATRLLRGRGRLRGMGWVAAALNINLITIPLWILLAITRRT